ncbi:hypothetical protein F8203_gp003 [Heliothis virescens ascovirus 3f]|uniref:Uncharacterized protein n=1 Tax=Heliothis virescens ascovirus 3f TaxID=328614 RepID=A0A171PV97_9VIRU|nr:hypothetical protein F8203_gp003 [Heliothis virescens ascovirus 3f]AJP08969.1 hypothetical protein [Heliothis virescens ascovirus 3f]
MEPDYVTVVVQVPIITLVNSLNLKLKHNTIDQPSCPGDVFPEECSKTHTVYKAVPCSKGMCIKVRYSNIERIIKVTAVDLKRYANVSGFEGEFNAQFSIDSYNRTLPKPIVSLNLGADNKLMAVNVTGPTVVNLLIVFSLENIIQNASIKAIFKNDYFGWDKLEAAYNSKKIQGVEEVKSPPILQIGFLVGFVLLLLLILQ